MIEPIKHLFSTCDAITNNLILSLYIVILVISIFYYTNIGLFYYIAKKISNYRKSWYIAISLFAVTLLLFCYSKYQNVHSDLYFFIEYSCMLNGSLFALNYIGNSLDDIKDKLSKKDKGRKTRLPNRQFIHPTCWPQHFFIRCPKPFNAASIKLKFMSSHIAFDPHGEDAENYTVGVEEQNTIANKRLKKQGAKNV